MEAIPGDATRQHELWRIAIGRRENDQHPLVKAYHGQLVREMVEQPLELKVAERILQPLIGKSLVLYGRRAA